MILNEDYNVTSIKDLVEIGIEILKEPFKNIIITFENVEIKENDEDKETCLLSFQYTIFNSQQYKEKELRENDQFNEYVADIMLSILDISLQNIKDSDSVQTDQP